MQGSDKPQLGRLLLVSALVMGGYMAYVYATKSDEPPVPAEERQPEAEAPAEERQPEGETGDEGQPEQEAGAGGDEGEGPRVEEPAPEQRRPPVDPAQRIAAERTATLETDEFVVTVTNLNTAVRSVLLKGERYLDEDGAPTEVVTTDQEVFLPLRLELGGVDMPEDAVWELERRSEQAVRFTWEGNGVRVTRDLEVGAGPYQIWSKVTVDNLGDTPRSVRVAYTIHHYMRSEDEGGGFLARQSPKLSHGICVWGEEVTRIDRELGISTRPGRPAHGFGPDVAFAGTENTYFASVVAADGEHAERCQITASNRGGTAEEPDGSLFETRLIYPRTEIAGGDQLELSTLAYLGPKDPDALETAGHHLSEVVDLGWFSAVAGYLVALLRIIQGYLGNWGLAIILMTVMVRIVLFPLTWKSFQSMARMRVLKPEMDRVNKLYKDDREKKGAAMMELYRKHKINPLGGCLPQLLQMPVWFAFYASLSTNVELYHANFILYWTDLSAPDPYYSLPLLLGGLMFFQQKISPTTMDAAQAKMMMYFMPIMITSFMLFLPSGLCLYMVTNSVLGIGQQQWIHHRLGKKEAERKELEAEQEAEEASAEAEAAEAVAALSNGSSVVSRTKAQQKPKSRKTSRRRTRRARS